MGESAEERRKLAHLLILGIPSQHDVRKCTMYPATIPVQTNILEDRIQCKGSNVFGAEILYASPPLSFRATCFLKSCRFVNARDLFLHRLPTGLILCLADCLCSTSSYDLS